MTHFVRERDGKKCKRPLRKYLDILESQRGQHGSQHADQQGSPGLDHQVSARSHGNAPSQSRILNMHLSKTNVPILVWSSNNCKSCCFNTTVFAMHPVSVYYYTAEVNQHRPIRKQL